MLPNKGAVKGRGSRTRGGLRGTASPNSGSRSRTDARKVHFEAQDGSSTSTSAPLGRENGAQRASRTLSREPRRINAALAKSFDNKSRSPSPSVQGGQQGSFNQRYQMLRKNRETERAQAIANGFLADPDKPRTLAEAITPVGTCQDMCAEYERLERIVQNDVWGPEMDPNSIADQSSKPTPDESRMVKKFRRAAAGIDEQLPSDLRPPHILQKTLNYLFDDVIGQASNLATVHHFVWDRTRAIRNDFSIQQVSKLADLRTTIDSYERIARFHILSLHQLALPQKPYDKYDAQQEREQLDKTLLSLMQLYDDSRTRLESPNEAEFRAYCIIFQIQDPVPDLEDRVQAWPRRIFQDLRVQRALTLYAAASNTLDDQGPLKPRTTHPIAQENWRRFWRIVSSNEVSYLMACVAEIYFGLVRRITLNSIWKSYRLGQSKRTEDWTLSELSDVLWLDDEEEVRDFCGNYGFGVEERADGTAFIDLNSVTGKTLPSPSSGTQMQSRTDFVEAKRHHRTLPAVINGLSVRAAKDAGLVETASEMAHLGENQTSKDSLFIRDSSDDEAAATVSQRNNKPASKSAQSKLNPFASSFQNTTSSFSTDNTPIFASVTSTNPSGTDQPQAYRSSSSDIKATAETSRIATNNSDATPVAPKSTPTSINSAPAPVFNFLKPVLGSFSVPSTAQNLQAGNLGFGTPSVGSEKTPTLFGMQSQQLARDIKADTPASQPPLPSFLSSLPAQSTPPAEASKLTSSPTEDAQSSSIAKTPFTWSFTAPNPLTQTPADANAPTSVSTPSFGFQTPQISQTPKISTPSIFHFSPQQLAPKSEISNTLPAQDQPFTVTPTVDSQPKVPAFNFGTPTNTTKPPQFPSVTSQNNSAPPPPKFPAASITSSPLLSPPQSHSFAPSSASLPSQTTNATKSSNDATASFHEPNKIPQRSAASIAASKAKASATMTRYARTLVEEPGGLLEQFIEFITLPMIRAIKEQDEAEEMQKEADTFRYDTLANRYGKRWRQICWNHRLSRQRRERRNRLAKAIEDQARYSRESSIQAQVDAFREMRSNSRTSLTNSRTPAQRKRHFENPPQRANEQRRSLSRSPPRERLMTSRQSIPSSADSMSNMGESTSKLRATNAGNTGSERFSISSILPSGSSRGSRGSIARRNDTTRSAYFKLKAMGLDPNSDTLFSSTATPNNRKRPQEVEFDTTPNTAKKQLLSVEHNVAVSSKESQFGHTLPKKSALTEEDEKLFAAVRAAREAMSDSVAFYKAEAAKEEAKNVHTQESRLKSSINSLRQEDWFNASVSSTSSSMSKQAPPKYRDRVSKFLPRERYADVLKQQNRAVLGRSWPRPSPTASSYASRTSMDQHINDHINVASSATNLRGGKPASVEFVKHAQPQAIFLNSDGPEPADYLPEHHIQPQVSERHMNGFVSTMDDENGIEQGETEAESEDDYNDVNDVEDGHDSTHEYLDGDDEEGDGIHYHAPAPIHNNRFGILEQEEAEEDDDVDEADGEEADDDEEVDDVDDEAGRDGFSSGPKITSKAPIRNMVSEEVSEEEEEEEEEEGEEEEASDSASDAESASRSASSSPSPSSDAEDDEDDEEEDTQQHQQSRRYSGRSARTYRAPAPSQTQAQSSWGGKSGTSAEDAIEL